MTDDLIAFLRRMLDEDQRIAQACLDSVGSLRAGDAYPDGSGTADRDDYPSYPWGVQEADLAHIARHDPARVLREVAAKRTMLRIHAPQSSTFSVPVARTPFCLICQEFDGTPLAPYPCDTIRAIAAVYAEHPDYREEWKP